MKKEMALGLLSLFLFFQLAYAQSIAVTPNEFSIELVGGENVSKNFTIEWDGEVPVVGYLSYEISEENGSYEGKELWVEFSENPIILEPNNPKEVVATIYSLPSIQPDVYRITIKATVYLQQIEKVVREVEFFEREKPVIKIRNVTIEKVKEVPVYFENTTRIQEMNFTILTLNKTIVELNNRISGLLKEIDRIKRKHLSRTQWYQVIISTLITFIVGHIIYQKVRRGKNVKNM